MKNFLFIIILSFLFFSCYKTVEDVRKIKKGISANELKYIMDEPEEIEIYPGHEEWVFYYDGGNKLNAVVVTIEKDKVTDFYSY